MKRNKKLIVYTECIQKILKKKKIKEQNTCSIDAMQTKISIKKRGANPKDENSKMKNKNGKYKRNRIYENNLSQDLEYLRSF
jgi:hypothetical protein